MRSQITKSSITKFCEPKKIRSGNLVFWNQYLDVRESSQFFGLLLSQRPSSKPHSLPPFSQAAPSKVPNTGRIILKAAAAAAASIHQPVC
jgi:hypothetical protein